MLTLRLNAARLVRLALSIVGGYGFGLDDLAGRNKTIIPASVRLITKGIVVENLYPVKLTRAHVSEEFAGRDRQM